MTDELIERLAAQLHKWYLEATREIDPENYNKKAQKKYRELNDDQKFIDRFIAKKLIEENIEGLRFEVEDEKN